MTAWDQIKTRNNLMEKWLAEGDPRAFRASYLASAHEDRKLLIMALGLTGNASSYLTRAVRLSSEKVDKT